MNMQTEIDMPISQLENTLYRRSFDDGWLDVLVGLGLTAIGASWIAELIPLGALIPAILIPFWKIGRDRLVIPRMEQPSFKGRRYQASRKSLMAWFIFGGGVLLAEIAIFLYARQSGRPLFDNMQNFIVALPVSLIGIGLLAGLMIGAKRFIVYALLTFTIGGFGVATDVDEPGFLIVASGLVILLSGMTMLLRFLRKHPLTESTDIE